MHFSVGVSLHKVHYFNVTTVIRVSNFKPPSWVLAVAVSGGGTISVRLHFFVRSTVADVVNEKWISWVDYVLWCGFQLIFNFH